MSTTPTSLALTTIADNSQIIASSHRNNYSAVQTAVNSLISFLSGGLSSQVVTSGGGTTINYAYPPGYEYAYAQITSNKSVTAASEATADVVVTAGSVTFDGATPVVVEFSSPRLDRGTTSVSLVLYDGSGSVGILGSFFTGSPGAPERVAYRLTPSAAAHVYSIRAYVDAGTGTVVAGAAGTGANVPAFIRITKV